MVTTIIDTEQTHSYFSLQDLLPDLLVFTNIMQDKKLTYLLELSMISWNSKKQSSMKTLSVTLAGQLPMKVPRPIFP